LDIASRPGLDALSYRVGTHSSFLETMKAGLSSEALSKLTTRDGSDPAIAWLDAWAVVADVLTFYQERIANEGFLRTATERRSVLELARLVGYEPRPGVAASTHLAFTVEEKAKSPLAPAAAPSTEATEDEPEVVIPAGSRAQSVPGPGELPQPFETSEDLTARAAWNQLQVRLTRPQLPEEVLQAGVLYFEGIATQLKPNDPLLIRTVVGSKPGLYRALTVEPDAQAQRTRVTFEPWIRSSALVEIARRAADEDRAGFPLESAMARRVLSVLEPLRADSSGADLRALARDEILPKLREEHRLAIEGNFTRLEPWIDDIISDLESAAGISESTTADAAVAAMVTGSSASPDVVETTSSSVALDDSVLAKLAQSPAKRLANSLHLRRDLDKTLAPDSDISARLLLAARPELRKVLYRAWRGQPPSAKPTLEVWALRLRASPFGHNAPPPLDLIRIPGDDTEDWPLCERAKTIFLESSYPQMLPGSWVAMERPGRPDWQNPPSPEPERLLVVTSVEGVAELSRSAYGLTGKSTRLVLEDPWLLEDDGEVSSEETFDVIRGTAVYAHSERLVLAEMPIPEPVCGGELELAGLYDGLEAGRWLIVSGERSDVLTSPANGEKIPGIPAAELVMVAEVRQGVQEISLQEISFQETWAAGAFNNETEDPQREARPGEQTHTTVVLAEPLAYCYERSTIKVWGNVAPATHGETREEVLGSGRASEPWQRFSLKQSPLTYVSARTPSGVESTLRVRVNDVLWDRRGSLFGLKPTDHVYTTQRDNEEVTTVVFGDGKRGARLPTGSENVRSVYRVGIGKPGNLDARRITQLVTRPLGVKDVVNPLPATGGADPESRDQARRNAPLAVMALDRLVSVQDYADFARTFAGIGRASAARLSDGRVQLVQVTIAGEDDIPIREDSELFANLLAALRRFGEPRQALRLRLRDRTFLALEVSVGISPAHLWEAVEPKIRAALLRAFGFQHRNLAQDALLSEVYRVIQGVRGVELVDVDVFGRTDPESPTGGIDRGNQPKDATGKVRVDLPAARLRALRDRIDAKGDLQPAQLLYLSSEVSDTLVLKERKR